MIKHLLLILVLLTITRGLCAQVTITGTVVSSDDGSELPGVSVVEKGTTNGTVTQSDGKFSISVKDANSTLVFYFVGYVTKEQSLNGRKDISIVLKVDCIRDWFDHQKIGVYLNSGVVNNPIGGKFEVAFPAHFGKGTLTSSISYQTNLDKNRFINGDVKLHHFIFNCSFDMDASWVYRNVEFEDKFESATNSFEGNFNFKKLGLIAGYSHLSFKRGDTKLQQSYSAPVVGIRGWLYGSLRLVLTGKVSIYKNKQEYFGQILRNSRSVDIFINFYKLDTFSELSLGLGKTFVYRLRKPQK